MARDESTYTGFCSFYGPRSGVRLIALGCRNQEATQVSKLLVPAVAIFSHFGHGVKLEQPLGQVIILCPWRSVNILNGMLFAWTINSDQIPADDTCRKTDLCAYLGERYKA